MNPTERNRRLGSFGIAILGLMGLMTLWLVVSPVSAKSPGAPVRCVVQTDRGVLTAGSPQKVIVKVSLLAEKRASEKERPPVNLAIVLDRSSSMNGTKIQKAKEAAVEALGRLGRRDIFSLVAYNHNVKTIVPAELVHDAPGIKSRIRGIVSGGNTALFGGVSQGAAEVRKYLGENYVNRIILLSDGLANVGPRSPEDLGRLGAALIKEGISVTTVGVGLDYNEDLMTRLSKKSDGNAYFVESSGDLPRIFAAELGDVLSVVAKKVRLVVKFPDGVKPLGIVGREGRIRGRTVEMAMNQLYGGQEKYALIEIEVPGRKVMKPVNIARAVVAYNDPILKRGATAKGDARIRFSRNEDDSRLSMNADVQKAYALTLSAMSQDRAITLADKGKINDAVATLMQSVRRLRDTGKRYQSAELLERANQTARQASEMSRRGMTKGNRKAMKTDAYQIQSQQGPVTYRRYPGQYGPQPQSSVYQRQSLRHPGQPQQYRPLSRQPGYGQAAPQLNPSSPSQFDRYLNEPQPQMQPARRPGVIRVRSSDYWPSVLEPSSPSPETTR